jgi:hypothetical protein
VAAAAECLRDLGNIGRALAAQAHAETTFGLLAKEQRHLDPLDGKRIVDQAFAVFFLRLAQLQSAMGDVHPSQAAVTMQSPKRLAKQLHLRELGGEIYVVRNLHRIGATLY